MGKSYKMMNLFKQSSVYYVGSIITMLSSIISLPILTRILSKNEYGMLSLIMLTTFLVTVPAKFGMQNSTVYYYDDFKMGRRPEGMETFYSTLFWGPFLISVVVAIVFLLLGNVAFKYFPNKNVVDFLWIIPALVITEAMIIRIQNFLRVEQRSVFFVSIGNLKSYGQIIFGLVYFYFISRTLHGIFIGFLLNNIMILLMCILVIPSLKEVKITSFSMVFFKKCMQYGYPFVGIEAAALLMKYVDRYLVEYFLGTSTVGVYSVAGNLSLAISNGIFSAIWLSLSPMYMKVYKTEGIEKTAEFVSKSVSILLLVFVPIVFGISSISYDIIYVLATAKFAEAAEIMPYMILSAAIWGLTPIYATGFYIKKKTNIYNRIIMVSTIINILLNFAMIPRFGIHGAALSALITYLIVFIATVKISFKYLRLKTDFIELAQYIIAGLIMYLIILNMNLEVSIVSLGLKIVTGIVVYPSIVLLLNGRLRGDLRKLIAKKF